MWTSSSPNFNPLPLGHVSSFTKSKTNLYPKHTRFIEGYHHRYDDQHEQIKADVGMCICRGDIANLSFILNRYL